MKCLDQQDVFLRVGEFAFFAEGHDGDDQGEESNAANEHVDENENLGGGGEFGGEVEAESDGAEGADELEEEFGVGDIFGLDLAQDGEVDEKPADAEDDDAEGAGAHFGGETAMEEDDLAGAAKHVPKIDGGHGDDGSA